jgi:hypothetical protein
LAALCVPALFPAQFRTRPPFHPCLSSTQLIY